MQDAALTAPAAEWVNPHWLWLCLASLTLSGATYYLFRVKLRKWCKRQLLEDPSRRLRPLQWILSTVPLGVFAIMWDKVDLSEVWNLRTRPIDIAILFLLCYIVPIYFLAVGFALSVEADVESERDDTARSLAIAKANAARLLNEIENERRLAAISNKIFGQRWGRVRDLIKTSGDKPPTVGAISEAFAPTSQVALIITSIHQHVFSHFQGGVSPEHHLRVAYYMPNDGHLVPVVSFDGNLANCIKTPGTIHKDRFRLTPDRARECLAIHCAMNGPTNPILIADADKAHEDNAVPYRHFSDQQKDQIKSIAGYCCRKTHGDEAPYFVLTLDCTQRGFFAEDSNSRLALKRMLDDLSLRLAYESDLNTLFQMALDSKAPNHREVPV